MKRGRKDLYISLPTGLDSQAVYKELENSGTIDQIRKAVLEKLRTEASIAGEDGFITAEQYIVNEINKTITTNKLAENMSTSGNMGEVIRTLNMSIQNFIYGSTTRKVTLKATLDLCFGEIDKFVYSSPLVRDQLITGVHAAMNTLYKAAQKEAGEDNSSSSSPATGGITRTCNICNGEVTPLSPKQCNGKAGMFRCERCKATFDITLTAQKEEENKKKEKADSPAHRCSTIRISGSEMSTIMASPQSEGSLVVPDSAQNTQSYDSSTDSELKTLGSSGAICDSLTHSGDIDGEIAIFGEAREGGVLLGIKSEDEPDAKRIKI